MIINRTHRENASGNILRIAIGISMFAVLLLVDWCVDAADDYCPALIMLTCTTAGAYDMII